MLLKKIIAKKEGLLIDIEGPLVSRIEGGNVYSDALTLLKEFSDLKIALLTNIARKSSRYISKTLSKYGLNFMSNQVINPTKAAINQVLGKEFSRPVRVYLISEGGHYEDIIIFDWIDIVRNEPIDAILLGANRNITYQELNFAFRCILKGAKLVVLGGDLWTYGSQYRDEGPYLMEGAFAKVLEEAAGVKARYVGKPNREIFIEAINFLNLPKEKILMIGDSVKTDIVGACLIGIDAVLIDRVGNKDVELRELLRDISCKSDIYYTRSLGPSSETRKITYKY